MGELMFYMRLLVLYAAILAAPLGVTAVCYFATEMQGEYITQTTVTHIVSYTHVNITEDSIPIWGLCHRRIANNIVLRMDSDETSCYKCIHVNLVSRNVLRIHTAEEDYGSTCYTNEEKAIASCPDHLDDQPTHKEIILYKSLEYNGQEIKRQYCPFNGRYRFLLTIDEGGPETTGCESKNSELDDCPSGSAINLRFRQCTFSDYEATLECMGQWKGHDGQNFLALMNTGYASFGPKYRCAVSDFSYFIFYIHFYSSVKRPKNLFFNLLIESKPFILHVSLLFAINCRVFRLLLGQLKSELLVNVLNYN